MSGFSLLAALTLIAHYPAQCPAGPTRLAVIQKAPDFSLTTQDNKSLGLADLKGKVLVVSFIFTTCSGTCPATTHRMGQLQQVLKDRGLSRDGRVHLVSITLDPARDTPETLRGYMRLFDADPAGWSFLTGPREQVEKVIAAWGMWAKPAANGQLDHPSRVFLVDPKGRIREIYDLNFFKAGWVLDDIELLLKE
jgi:protein SCO1/2